MTFATRLWWVASIFDVHSARRIWCLFSPSMHAHVHAHFYYSIIIVVVSLAVVVVAVVIYCDFSVLVSVGCFLRPSKQINKHSTHKWDKDTNKIEKLFDLFADLRTRDNTGKQRTIQPTRKQHNTNKSQNEQRKQQATTIQTTNNKQQRQRQKQQTIQINKQTHNKKIKRPLWNIKEHEIVSCCCHRYYCC